MPPRTGKLGSALLALSKGLNATGAPWMCIGGIAVIAQGVRRTTTDIDVTVRGEGVHLDAFVKALARHGIRPRINDALKFARSSQVLLLEHSASGVALDVSLAWLSFEHEALAARIPINFAGVIVPAARPEDLLIYKVFAGRPHDLQDAESLLLMHKKSIDLTRVRAVLSQLSEMSDEPGGAARLESIIERKRSKPGRTRRP